MAVMILGGLAGLIFGGEMFLDNATAVARRLGVSDSVIALTLVAGGTSLPELASSVVSLLKGKAGMALGNVIGSNIANILLILGLSATIRPLTPGGITALDFGMGGIEFAGAIPRGLHIPPQGHRPSGGHFVPGRLRPLPLAAH